MTDFTWLAIFVAIEPFPGALHRWEFDHDKWFGSPIALENFLLTAGGNVFAIIFFDNWCYHFFVFLETDRIDNLEFDNYVCRHGGKLIRKAGNQERRIEKESNFRRPFL